MTGEEAELRAAPGIGGKAFGLIYPGEAFIAEAEPIAGAGGNSTWYRLFFRISAMNDNFHRFDKSEEYNFSTPYIDAKDVRQVPLSDTDKEEIEFFKGGRLPRYNVGDYIGPLDLTIAKLRKPGSLFMAPNKDAETRVFPAGTKILTGEGAWSPDFHLYEEGIYYYHVDMDDVMWQPVFDENERIMGWVVAYGSNFWESL